MLEKGPVRGKIEVRCKLKGELTTFVRQISIFEGVPWIDFSTRIEFTGQEKFIKAAFPLNLHCKESVWELPYGVVKRENTGKERPALKWVDLSGEGKGVSLFNRSRYGYDVKDNVVRLSLLRSPTHPAHNDDSGIHTVNYALFPHKGDWAQAKVYKRAYEYNFPLITCPVETHPGLLPLKLSFFKVEPGNLVITEIKRAEKKQDLVLRIVEMEGKATKGKLTSYLPFSKAYEADLLERRKNKLFSEGKEVEFLSRAFEIKTIMLEDWGRGSSRGMR